MHRRRLLATLSSAAVLGACAQPTAPTASRIRVGVASCADQTAPQPLWDAVLADPPDLFVFAGDNVYASQQPFQVQALRDAYAQAAAISGFARLRERMPHLAIWDDHDYGQNDGGASFAFKAESKAAFIDFWRLPPDDPRRAREGLYHAQVLQHAGRRVQVIVLDTRWFRSPLKPTDQRDAPGRQRWIPDDDPTKTMLGEAQWAWLAQQLRQPADLRLVVSSIQLVAEGHGFERWGNLPRERERFYRLLRDTDARGVVVLSGDRHIGGVYREIAAPLPRPLTEMTSSGVTHPWATAREPGPNRVGDLVGVRHWGEVDADFAARRVTLRLRGEDGADLRRHDIPFDELGLP